MVTVSIECPKCGRRGTVPLTRINVPLNCKKCQAPFYVNASGETLPGSPRETMEARRQDDEARRLKEEKGHDSSFAVELPSLGTIEPSSRLKLVAGALLVVGAACGLYVLTSGPAVDPVIERGESLVKALADNDLDAIKSAATGETAQETALWIERGRAIYGIDGGAKNYTIRASVLDGGGQTTAAHLIATLDPINTPADAKDAAAASGIISLELYLVKDFDGEWRLDGHQTLDKVPAMRQGPALRKQAAAPTARR